MKTYEKVLCFLQSRMETPQAWGWFHMMWLVITVITIVLMYISRSKYSEKQLKWTLGIYGFVALFLEILKQIIWTFHYDAVTGITTWDYQWYAAPFQLCTTPIFASIASVFVKKGKVRSALMSYMAYVTIWGAIATMIIPKSCFTDQIEVNVHTMWLHCGSFVVSIYLLMSGAVKDNKQSILGALTVFGLFATMANVLNIAIYNSGILHGETFNMFYISPYFVSELPVFDKIWQSVPYVIFLLTYLAILSCSAGVIWGIQKFFKRRYKKI